MTDRNEIEIIKEDGVYAGFSLRTTTAVRRRAYLAKKAEEKGGAVIWPQLVHGKDIEIIGKEALGKGLVEFEDRDGAVTDVPGVCLTVTCGDCLPIYAWDPVRRAAGLVHAGWRGTLEGIAGELVSVMGKAYGSDPADLIVRIGPGIDACCFEVREDCYDLFLDKYPWAEDFLYSRPDGTFSLDIKGINLEILSLCGVEDASASPHCTCCEADLFYSWRRSGEKDRMLAYMVLGDHKPAAAISACLLGYNCRYDGRPRGLSEEKLAGLREKYDLVPVCPEVMGGLPTPRYASEIRGDKVIMKMDDGGELVRSMASPMAAKSIMAKMIEADGEITADVTGEYEAGARFALAKAAEAGARIAILKDKSPSCGSGLVYDGTFTRTLTEGDGICCRLFKENGIEVLNSKDL